AVDVVVAEPLLEVDAVHGVDGAREVGFVAEGHGGVDAHAALEAGVRGGPVLLAGGHPLGGLEGLADAAGDRVQDFGVRVHAGRQRPHDIVHAVHVDIGVHSDGEAHALAAGEDGAEEVALPALLDLVPLLDLDDAAAPVGHAVWDVYVLDDPRLQALAQLVDRRLADGGVDVAVVGGVDAEREDDRAARAAAHRDSRDVERWGLVGLAHVAGPLGVEDVLALLPRRLGLGGLVALVARVEVALQHVLAVGHGVGVDGASLDQADRRALDRAGRAQLVGAARQHDVVEAAAGDERAGGRQPEAHGERDRLVVVVVLGDDLPHVGAGRRLERADVAPAEVHPVVADVAAAVEVLAHHHAVTAADSQLGL